MKNIMNTVIDSFTEQPQKSVAVILCLLLMSAACVFLIHWIFTHIYLFYDAVCSQHQSYVLNGLQH